MSNTNALGATEATLADVDLQAQSIILLRRIVKLMESQAVVDSFNRQRVTVDGLTGGLTLFAVASVASVTAQTALAGMDREMYINQSRVAYANCIRAKLT